MKARLRSSSGGNDYHEDNVVQSRAPKADFSKIAEYYDKVRRRPAEIWWSRIVQYGRIDADFAVLDIGCGTGRLPLAIWTARNCRVSGLEPSIEMLKQAVAEDSSIDILWVCGDGLRLPFRGESFHCVYMTMVIHHIENKDLIYREMYRVLKNGGS